MSLLLRRLRRAIQKVSFLLSFDVTSWLLSSGRARRRLSFTGDTPSDCPAGGDSSHFADARSASALSRTISSTWSSIVRTISSTSGGGAVGTAATSSRGESWSRLPSSSSDDIDERSAAFIINFKKHLVEENLQVPYSRENSLEEGSGDFTTN